MSEQEEDIFEMLRQSQERLAEERRKEREARQRPGREPPPSQATPPAESRPAAEPPAQEPPREGRGGAGGPPRQPAAQQPPRQETTRQPPAQPASQDPPRQQPLQEPRRQEPRPDRPQPQGGQPPERRAGGNTSRYRFLNPYNFVRPLEDPATRLAGKAPELTLLGRCAPPPHDRYVGLTGRITCLLEAKTPLFISDAHGIWQEEVNGKSHRHYRFFQDPDGTPAIPGTSLRGMLRSVFEAATNSCFGVFQRDEEGGKIDRLEYRVSADPGLTPARVLAVDAKGATIELLDCTTMGAPAGVDMRRVVKVGLALAYDPCVARWNAAARTWIPFAGHGIVSPNAEDGERVAVSVSDQPLDHDGRYRYIEVRDIVRASNHTKLTVQRGEVKVFGYLHKTGPNIENKHDERVFFRWDDQDPRERLTYHPQDIHVDEHVIDEYNRSLAKYWERHAERVEELDKATPPWPRNTVPWPSTFVREGRRLKAGDLVYYYRRHGTAHLCPVSMPRIPYSLPREKLLDQHLHRCTDAQSLCPACRVFGWVHEEGGKLDKGATTAYSGRVRFSSARLTDGSAGVLPPTTLAILGSPKPTTTRFYLRKKEGEWSASERLDDEKAGYSKDNILRGRKFYRHHGDDPSRNRRDFEYVRATQLHASPPDEGKDHQNRTVHETRKAGSQFVFTVDFHNLAPTEFAALLWSLELETGMFHRLGFAKPLGFGSVKLKVTKLELMTPGARYGSLTEAGGWEDVTQTLDRVKYVETNFKSWMTALYGSAFGQLANIRDLRALLSQPLVDLPIHYPRSSQLPDPEGKNFEWFVGNKRKGAHAGPHHALKVADADTEGLPLLNRRGEEV